MHKKEFARPKDEGSLVDVYVTPGAWKTLFVGLREDRCLRVSVSAPAEDGKANKELLRHFKKFFGECELVSGEKSRRKTIYVKNTKPDELGEVIKNYI